MKPAPGSKLPVHIVEQHNDVVPFIHRAIASKQLPFSGVPIIHLDSHPDLLIAVHLDADTVFKPQELYEALSIENWLLPLTYAKHIDHVIWVKPPWANQIKPSEQSFSIGKCCHTGKLRLSCKENYFLTDGLFCVPQDLSNATECKLTVVELYPPNWKDLDPCCAKSTLSSQTSDASEYNNTCENESKSSTTETAETTIGTKTKRETDTADTDDKLFKDYEKWTNHLQEFVAAKPYILDIDLDFFSTKNPFKEEFESEKEAVQRIFKCPVLTGSSDKEIENFTSLRQEQLEQLEIVFTALDDKWSGEEAAATPPEELTNMSLANLTGLDLKELEYFDSDQQNGLHSLCQSVLPVLKTREITFGQIYDFGCTLDDTDLPHHVSSDAQIEALMSSFKSVLVNLSRPAVVTISRSSHDDYCPKDQVDKIELMVLKLLTDTFGSLDVTKNFNE